MEIIFLSISFRSYLEALDYKTKIREDSWWSYYRLL